MSIRPFPLLGVTLALWGLGCASTPNSTPVARQKRSEMLDASAVVVTEYDGVLAADSPSAAPIAPAPTFVPDLPPLPPPSITSRTQYFPVPPPCASGKGWDGVGCVSTTCAEGSRFEVWSGCTACGFLGCGSNRERRGFFADDDQVGSAPPFNRSAADAALATLVPSMCRRAEGPTGSGHAKIRFRPSGVVDDVTLDAGPFAGTLVGRCIVMQLRSLRIPPFDGGSVSVGRPFTVDK